MFERGPRTNTEGTKRRRDRRRWKERKRDRENIQEIAVTLTTTTGATTVLHATKTFSGTDDGRGVLCGGGRGMEREQGVERLGSKEASPRQNKSVFVIILKSFVSIIIGVISIKISPIVHAAWEPSVSVLPIQSFRNCRSQSSFFGSSFIIQRD